MSTLLFNAVTYDQTTALYTYDYAVQNNGASNIWDVAILVGNQALGTYNGLQPLIPDYTAPNAWNMFGSFSGSIGISPYNESGGFYEWNGNDNPVLPGTTMFDFSVTTRFAPTLDNGLNDFFLYGDAGVTAWGNVVVPSGADWYIPPPYNPPLWISGVPEPSTWLMLLIGFAALSAARRRLTVHPAPLSLARR